jgi:L-fucose isomerase-like protein
MGNSPLVKLAIIGVSRDCFPVELTQRRLAALAEACKAIGLEPYVCEQIIENERDAAVAFAMCKGTGANAAIIYLGNFGPEGPISIFAREFDKYCGPVMLCGAAEESGENLIDGRGDALCGMLSGKLNCDMRGVRIYLPRRPVDLPDQLAWEIAHFRNVARVVLGLRSLKIITFGPRPHDFLACNAPIEQLLAMGIEVMENSELDLLRLFEAIREDDADVTTTVVEMTEELGDGNKYPDLLPRLARLEVALKRFA